jgi:hypothetical protein
VVRSGIKQKITVTRWSQRGTGKAYGITKSQFVSPQFPVLGSFLGRKKASGNGASLGNFFPTCRRERIETLVNLDPTARSPAKPDEPLRNMGRRSFRFPGKALLVLGLFLLVAALVAVHTAVTQKDCSLRLRVQHGFLSAQLYVWVDDGLVYSGRLIGSRKTIRPSKKKLKSVEPVEGSLSEAFAVPAGEHEVRVRVAAEDGSVQENSVRGDFVSHSQRTLSVVARGNDVSMDWESKGQEKASPASPESAPVQDPEGWLQRYAGSLLISIVGSIVSAFTGYAIKELPKKIAPTQDDPPRTRSASAGR